MLAGANIHPIMTLKGGLWHGANPAIAEAPAPDRAIGPQPKAMRARSHHLDPIMRRSDLFRHDGARRLRRAGFSPSPQSSVRHDEKDPAVAAGKNVERRVA